MAEHLLRIIKEYDKRDELLENGGTRTDTKLLSTFTMDLV